MRLRLVAFAALAIIGAGCDSEEPAPDAFFVADVRDASGGPAAGLDLFVVYGDLVTARTSAPHGEAAALDVLGPYPNPTTASARVDFTAPASGRTTIRLFDVAGEMLTTLADDMFSPSERAGVFLDLRAYPAGVYRLRIEGGGETADRTLIKTDAPSDGPSPGLAVFLGRTDGAGRVMTDDRTRFPSLFDVPPVLVIDDQGNVLSEFRLTPSAALALQDGDGRTSQTRFTVRDRPTAVDLTFEP